MTTKIKVLSKIRQREVILHLWDEGIRDAKEIHRRTNIGLSTIYYNLKKLETKGDVAQKPGQGRPKKLTNKAAKVLGQQIRRNPTLSTSDLAKNLSEKGISDTRLEGIFTIMVIGILFRLRYQCSRLSKNEKGLNGLENTLMIIGHALYFRMKHRSSYSETQLLYGISIIGQSDLFQKTDKKFMHGVDFHLMVKPAFIALLV